MDRRSFLRRLGQAGTLAALSGAAGLGYANRIERFDHAITEVTIPLHNLAPSLNGFRIVQLSDFHVEDTGLSYLERVVDEVNRLRPDLIALTGDFVSHDADAARDLAPVLKELRAKHGVLASLGNHDAWSGAARVRRHLERQGLPVLVNERMGIKVEAATLHLAGLASAWGDRPDLTRALQGTTATEPVILLMHEPDVIDGLAGDERISLQLSGHSHGGQIKVPLLGPPVLPYLGRRYPEGRYRIGKAWLYTNRGIGTSAVPFRFNCRPEIAVLKLEQA